MARQKNDINASSTADIAFLLLIFYLVTTTMNVDSGISRVLPPIGDEKDDKGIDVKQRNTLQVYVNLYDQIMVGGKQVTNPEEIVDIAKEFILNPNDDVTLPEKENVDIPLIGSYPVTKGIISLQNDRGTTYETYIKVQNVLTKAYNQVQDDLAHQKFGKGYADLNDDERKAIRTAIPNKISEAEPRDLTSKAAKKK